ncbi:Lar family restriction alleviation protein [Oligella urethralis]|uniref:Lar family restriction alleviation protein n=1 Tax=Oligella urethralis TaxID=90245 RepID=UPI003990B5AA
MTSNKSIKPCPLCGANAKLEPMPSTNRNWWRVQCSSYQCGATLWPLTDQKEVVTRWNRRATLE